MPALDDDLTTAQQWVRDASRVTVLTGAGISTDSGIPDFRGPNGLWTKNPAAEKASTLQHYLADAAVRRAAWQTRLHSPAWDAQPNAGQRAGNDPAKVIEVHGTMRWARCWECGDRRPMDELLARVRAGDGDPACAVCGGIVKSDTISFGQSLVPEVIDAAAEAAQACDVLIAAGSTLTVFPAANLVPLAKAVGAKVVIVNAQSTGMDRYADAVLLGQLSELLPRLVD
jgi:NAD-dependent deacetylase